MKKGMIFCLGVAVGGVIGFIAAKQYHHKKALKEAEEIRAFYAKKQAELNKKEKELNGEVDDSAKDESTSATKVEIDPSFREKYNIAASQYNNGAVHKNDPSILDIKVDDSVKQKPLDIKVNPYRVPYDKGSGAVDAFEGWISEQRRDEVVNDDFPYIFDGDPNDAEETTEWKKEELFYYEDDILADANTDWVVDAMDLVAYSNLDKIPHYDGAVVYVRNPRLNTQYKITRDIRTYSEATGKYPVWDDEPVFMDDD